MSFPLGQPGVLREDMDSLAHEPLTLSCSDAFKLLRHLKGECRPPECVEPSELAQLVSGNPTAWNKILLGTEAGSPREYVREFALQKFPSLKPKHLCFVA